MAIENYADYLKASTTNAASLALDLRKPVAQVVTAGAAATLTLGAPELPGLRKVVECVGHDGTNNATMALTNVVVPATISTNSTTLTFSASNQAVVMFSGNVKWLLVSNNGAAIT